VVPASLLEMSRSVFRHSFSAIVPKTVYTFAFSRRSRIDSELLKTMRVARDSGAIVVASPQSVKAFMLKLVEMMHILDTEYKRSSMTSTYSSVMSYFYSDDSAGQRYTQNDLDVMRSEIQNGLLLYKVCT